MVWKDIILETSTSSKVDDLKTAFVKVKNNLDYLKSSSVIGYTDKGSGQSIIDSLGNSTLVARTIKAGDKIQISVDTDGSVKVSAIDTNLINDPNPVLNNNLDTHGFTIYNSLTGRPVKINDITISDLNNDTLITTINNLNIKSTDTVNGKIIFGSPIAATNISAIGFYGQTNGLHVGAVSGNVTGNLTGNSNGTHTGNVIGNVVGTTSDISNHSIVELNDVSDAVPSIGDIFKWDGTKYAPIPAYAVIPTMSTNDRDLLSADNGAMIYNTTTGKFEGLSNGMWVDLS